MNTRMIGFLLGRILMVEAGLLALPLLTALLYGEPLMPWLATMLVLAAIGWGLSLRKPERTALYAKDGFAAVALVWLLMSAFGALPFVLSGDIPNYIDAFFETVSGFTTTGASILTAVEPLSRGGLLWRSFTHWIGGMGVLVLTLALLPQMTGRTSHLVRAESPGPSLSKIVPKMGDSAKILYLIYAALTALQFAVLLLAGMNPYDAAIHTFGTAGTGGFSNYGASIAAFHSPLIEWIITFFMVLFGINFALFYRAITGDWRDTLRSEELHWYLGIYGAATIFSTMLLLPRYHGFWKALRYGSFQVASVMSTTGYATADFNLWPVAVKMVLLLVMIVGGCAGSTAGGIKVVRTALLFKLGRREIRHTFQPRKVQVVRFEGKGVEEGMLSQVAMFFCVYVLMLLLGAFAISLEGRFDVETNLTAALTCLSNVGPGLGAVGPVENFAGYGPFAKLVLSLLMLAGRLELFPILALFHPAIWRKS